MKKVISFIIILTLALMFTGCSPSSSSSTKNLSGLSNLVPGDLGGSTSSKAPVVTAKAPSLAPQSSVAGSGSVTDNGLVNSLETFFSIQYKSIQLLYNKIQTGEEDQNLNDSVQASYALYQTTMSMLPIETIAGGDAKNSMEESGVTDISVSQNGDVYTISFTAQETSYKIETQYDGSTDSMTAKMYASGQLKITFEYAAQNSGYAAQAYADNGSGGYQVYTDFVDGSSVAAFGSANTASAPQSIFKNKSLSPDFVKSGSFYCVLNGSNLSVTENGTTTTY